MARILVTSALPYINGIKHLGNLAGSMLPADVYSRYNRALGNEVLYICATDEHGTPAELAAASAEQDVRSYCDEQHRNQFEVGKAFGLSWDWFGRTSSPANHKMTQHFGEVLSARGFIDERLDEMVYSPDDNRFLPDRFVEGTCPRCGSPGARGDQCDACGSLLEPTELISPYSVISGSKNLETRKTRHLYLLQSKLQGDVRAWVDQRAANWPLLTRSIAYKHLDEGLLDRGITRDLKWGIPVTKDGVTRKGFEDKVYYVWFDAPIAYISATIEWAEVAGQEWERWWLNDRGAANVTYVQFMGKDNVAFHTVSFPATILASGEPWKTVDKLKSFNWLNWYGGKFSTSKRRGVFMNTALDLLPADYWRWYLLTNSPENADSAFTWEHFQLSSNSDLADVLGNYVNRVLKFAIARFEGKIPEPAAFGPLEDELIAEVSVAIRNISTHLDALEYRKATQELRALWAKGNEYLQKAAPWSAIKIDKERAGTIVYAALNLIGVIGRLSAPFIPFTSDTILRSIGERNLPNWPSKDARCELTKLQPGSTLIDPGVLFQKIENEQVAEWSAAYGGASS